MYRKDVDAWVAVVSSGRPKNVLPMRGIVGPATWYVPEGQGRLYLESCANKVVESGGLCESRNQALADAFAAGKDCVQLSDDLRRLVRVEDDKTLVPLPFSEAVDRLHAALLATGAKLAGVAPTTNPFYYNPKVKVSQHSFIVGDFILVRPCDLVFDVGLKLKEDYDYTLKHLNTVGMVARCNDLFAYFTHRSNAGGAVAVRTPALEQAAIARLRETWGAQRIVDNAKRPNEVLLRWK